MNQDKIKVLIVDDSGIRREMLKHILNSDGEIEVIATAKDGKDGLDKTLALSPDVITIDVNMPVMNGFDTINAIMQQKPTPIIVVSSIEVKTVVKALSIGAMDFVSVSQELEDIVQELCAKVKIASRVRPLRRIDISHYQTSPPPFDKGEQRLIAIGASTGGPAALQQLLPSLPKDLPAAVLVVQHIASGFIQELANFLRTGAELDIAVARKGDVIENGKVYFAPDDVNMIVDSQKRIDLVNTADTDLPFKPSIDVMMRSAAEVYGCHAVGIILTGMGRDGALGIKAIRQSGGATIAQDESTSVIYGMNKIAVDNGDIDVVLPLNRITNEIVQLCHRQAYAVKS